MALMSLPQLVYFLLLIILVFQSLSTEVQARNSKTFTVNGHDKRFHTLKNLQGCEKGQTHKGISQLKRYLGRFGYLHIGNSSTINLTDEFDENLETALKLYQEFHRINVTGKLDASTIKHMSIPRCGVADIVHSGTEHNHGPAGKFKFYASLYNFFPNSPKWDPSHYHLTYSFRSGVQVDVPLGDVKAACANAFNTWSTVSPLTFEEAAEGTQSNIVIGFYRGDHGDNEPFDGPGGILAHSFPPEDGRFHYDADEKWSTNPDATKQEFDLESLALHEIGHLLGLGHSSDPQAVMVSGIAPGAIKRQLGQDDIDGIQALYSSS